jgi:hypothetical protein
MGVKFGRNNTMNDIREIPIWENCPFRDKVPEVYQIRRGKINDDEVFAIVYDDNKGTIKHAMTRFKLEEIGNVEEFVKLIVDNLNAVVYT